MIFQLALYQLNLSRLFSNAPLCGDTGKCKTLQEIAVVAVRPGRALLANSPLWKGEGSDQWAKGLPEGVYIETHSDRFILKPHPLPLTMCSCKALYAPRLQFYKNLFQPNTKKQNKTTKHKTQKTPSKAVSISNHLGSSLSSLRWLAEATRPVTHFKFTGH